MTVDPVYTPTPISQRDGSALANSNCRMASIATGIDYDSRGSVRSTGAKMRAFTSDQSGGTDSADAVQSWRNGYSRTLTVRDGYTFDNAEQDLAKGSGVHLDVWHASLGSQGCLSGSGAYGHTIYVHPDELSDGTKWRVADPWCSPAAWRWITKAALRAGAEEWGRRVYGAAVQDVDYPTGGDGRIGDPRHPAALAIIRRIARELMTLAYPGSATTLPDVPTPRDWPAETGGGAPILFTRTAALGVAGGGSSGGSDEMARFVQSNGYGVGSTKRLHVADGTDWYYLDGSKGGDFSGVADLAVVGIVDGSPGDWGVLISTGKPYDDGSARTTIAYVKGGTPYDVEPEPGPEPPPDEGETADEAYSRGRTDEYNAWYEALGLPDPPP